jgi:hypothetical protein
MSDTEYNGWANEPTWYVWHWLSATQTHHTPLEEQARHVIADLQSDWDSRESYLTLEEYAYQQIGERVSDYVDEMLEDLPEIGMFRHFIAAGLRDVNWTDIGQAYFEAVEGLEAAES